jgi:drug/metabolite transporter (DMT)-like permease
VKSDTKGMLIGFGGIAIFSLTLPVSKIAVQVLDPYFIVFGRAALAGLVALAYLIAIRAPLPARATLPGFAWIALGAVFGFPLFITIAMMQGPSSNGAVILGILPLVTTVLGALRFKERPSIGFWLSSLVGTGLVLLYALMQGAGQFSFFDGLLMAACVCAAVGYVEGAKLSAIMKPKIVISWALVFSLPISLLFSALSYQTDYIYAGLDIWLSFAYLGIFSMFVGFFFWYEGLRIGGIARVSQVQLLQPFCTLLASSVLLSEPLTLLNLVFAALVVSTVMVGKRMLIKVPEPTPPL